MLLIIIDPEIMHIRTGTFCVAIAAPSAWSVYNRYPCYLKYVCIGTHSHDHDAHVHYCIIIQYSLLSSHPMYECIYILHV